MKKILTVSLFAIMAVSAANAEIASTNFVTDRTGDTQTLNKIGANEAKPASLTEGVNQLNVYITDQLAEVESGAGVLVDGVANDLAAYIQSNNTAVQAAQTAADTAQGEVDALKEAVAQQKTDLTGAIATAKSEAIADAKTETTNQVNALTNGAVKTNTESIAAINDAENGILAQAKIYADTEDKKIEDTIGTVESGKTVVQMITDAKNAASSGATDALDAYKQSNDAAVAAAQQQADKGVADAATAQTAADTAQGKVDALEEAVAQQKTDLTGAIATAKSEAIADAKTETTNQVNALTNGAVKTNTDNISTITTNLGGLNGIAIPEACATGRCALVMENNQAKWETINY